MIMIANLKEAGLSENEAKVYLTMLELGPSSVLEIASEARVNRPTAYVQLVSRKKDGACIGEKEGWKTCPSARELPEKLEFLLNKQRAEVEIRRDELLRVMPDSMAVFDLTEEKPIIRYFEERKG